MESVLKHDGIKPTADNIFSAKTLVQTWINVAESFGSHQAAQVIDHMVKTYGLKQTISSAQASADRIVRNNDMMSLFNDITDFRDDSVALQVLRFPKRFSYPQDTLDAIPDFLQRSKELREIQDTVLVREIKSIMEEILLPDRFDFDRYLLSELFNPPTGMAHTPDGPVYSWNQKASVLSEYIPIFKGRPIVGYDWPRENKVLNVPKNYKTSRVICAEHPCTQAVLGALGGYVKDRLIKHSRGAIDITDQTRNVDLARLASLTNRLATIDLSAASDSLSWSLLYRILPDRLFWYVSRAASIYHKVNGQRIRTRVALTMGTRLTFPLETCIFYAVVLCAKRWNREFGRQFAVYGDDIIVDSSIAMTVIDILEELGFQVNLEKTFIDSPFRESCGGDFIEGLDVSSRYWPRSPISKDVKSVSSLVALQHRFYDNMTVSLGLQSAIREITPNLGYCEPFEPYDMIWLRGAIPKVHPERTTSFSLAGYRFRDRLSWDGRRINSVQNHVISGVEKIPSRIERTSIRAVHQTDSVNADLWRYYDFLYKGPYYPDEVCRLAGVSVLPPDRDQISKKTDPARLVRYQER